MKLRHLLLAFAFVFSTFTVGSLFGNPPVACAQGNNCCSDGGWVWQHVGGSCEDNRASGGENEWDRGYNACQQHACGACQVPSTPNNGICEPGESQGGDCTAAGQNAGTPATSTTTTQPAVASVCYNGSPTSVACRSGQKSGDACAGYDGKCIANGTGPVAGTSLCGCQPTVTPACPTSAAGAAVVCLTTSSQMQTCNAAGLTPVNGGLGCGAGRLCCSGNINGGLTTQVPVTTTTGTTTTGTTTTGSTTTPVTPVVPAPKTYVATTTTTGTTALNSVYCNNSCSTGFICSAAGTCVQAASTTAPLPPPPKKSVGCDIQKGVATDQFLCGSTCKYSGNIVPNNGTCGGVKNSTTLVTNPPTPKVEIVKPPTTLAPLPTTKTAVPAAVATPVSTPSVGGLNQQCGSGGICQAGLTCKAFSLGSSCLISNNSPCSPSGNNAQCASGYCRKADSALGQSVCAPAPTATPIPIPSLKAYGATCRESSECQSTLQCSGNICKKRNLQSCSGTSSGNGECASGFCRANSGAASGTYSCADRPAAPTCTRTGDNQFPAFKVNSEACTTNTGTPAFQCVTGTSWSQDSAGVFGCNAPSTAPLTQCGTTTNTATSCRSRQIGNSCVQNNQVGSCQRISQVGSTLNCECKLPNATPVPTPALRAAGASCTTDSQCQKDLRCSGGFCKKTNGMACTQFIECVSGSCRAASGIAGLICQDPTPPPTATPVNRCGSTTDTFIGCRVSQVGSACVSNNQRGTCERIGGVGSIINCECKLPNATPQPTPTVSAYGGRCTTDAQCERSLSCSAGVCKKRNGETCQFENECTSRYCIDSPGRTVRTCQTPVSTPAPTATPPAIGTSCSLGHDLLVRTVGETSYYCCNSRIHAGHCPVPAAFVLGNTLPDGTWCTEEGTLAPTCNQCRSGVTHRDSEGKIRCGRASGPSCTTAHGTRTPTGMYCCDGISQSAQCSGPAVITNPTTLPNGSWCSFNASIIGSSGSCDRCIGGASYVDTATQQRKCGSPPVNVTSTASTSCQSLNAECILAPGTLQSCGSGRQQLQSGVCASGQICCTRPVQLPTPTENCINSIRNTCTVSASCRTLLSTSEINDLQNQYVSSHPGLGFNCTGAASPIPSATPRPTAFNRPVCSTNASTTQGLNRTTECIQSRSGQVLYECNPGTEYTQGINGQYGCYVTSQLTSGGASCQTRGGECLVGVTSCGNNRTLLASQASGACTGAALCCSPASTVSVVEECEDDLAAGRILSAQCKSVLDAEYGSSLVDRAIVEQQSSQAVATAVITPLASVADVGSALQQAINEDIGVRIAAAGNVLNGDLTLEERLASGALVVGGSSIGYAAQSCNNGANGGDTLDQCVVNTIGAIFSTADVATAGVSGVRSISNFISNSADNFISRSLDDGLGGFRLSDDSVIEADFIRNYTDEVTEINVLNPRVLDGPTPIRDDFLPVSSSTKNTNPLSDSGYSFNSMDDNLDLPNPETEIIAGSPSNNTVPINKDPGTVTSSTTNTPVVEPRTGTNITQPCPVLGISTEKMVLGYRIEAGEVLAGCTGTIRDTIRNADELPQNEIFVYDRENDVIFNTEEKIALDLNQTRNDSFNTIVENGTRSVRNPETLEDAFQQINTYMDEVAPNYPGLDDARADVYLSGGRDGDGWLDVQMDPVCQAGAMVCFEQAETSRRIINETPIFRENGIKASTIDIAVGPEVAGTGIGNHAAVLVQQGDDLYILDTRWDFFLPIDDAAAAYRNSDAGAGVVDFIGYIIR